MEIESIETRVILERAAHQRRGRESRTEGRGGEEGRRGGERRGGQGELELLLVETRNRES